MKCPYCMQEITYFNQEAIVTKKLKEKKPYSRPGMVLTCPNCDVILRIKI